MPDHPARCRTGRASGACRVRRCPWGSYGQQVGLDRGKLGACFDAQSSKPRVDEGKHEGDELSVNQTPTFYINGKILAGGAPPDVFYQAVDDALKGVKQ